MKLYIAVPQKGTSYFCLANDIRQANIAARKFFGSGISYTVREARDGEFASWVDSRPFNYRVGGN